MVETEPGASGLGLLGFTFTATDADADADAVVAVAVAGEVAADVLPPLRAEDGDEEEGR